MKTKKILSISGILLFFLGFPMFGLMYFWQDMHRKMQNDAVVPVRQLAEVALAEWDDEAIGRRLGPEVDLDKMDAKVTELKAKYGPLKTLGESRASRTWAHEFKDQVWNFARYEYPATFEKGEAVVRFTGTRLYFEKDWKIHDIEIVE
jgi:hypothetical protein